MFSRQHEQRNPLTQRVDCAPRRGSQHIILIKDPLLGAGHRKPHTWNSNQIESSPLQPLRYITKVYRRSTSMVPQKQQYGDKYSDICTASTANYGRVGRRKANIMLAPVRFWNSLVSYVHSVHYDPRASHSK